eukprot:NODE_3353_length_783_cov_71.826975_g2802_i0.p2 GENE.NODE_3353_length_783_cov_71.826975_g2802_i0~~NODE_3353_length_783_cov_71.826975_g2802_i0.p2  ORF type:complete len:50 (-),score=4.10 NODE_3353_length_783_cov_71.826975_g2802_i0:364-513(-)
MPSFYNKVAFVVCDWSSERFDFSRFNRSVSFADFCFDVCWKVWVYRFDG